jgi:hypothetical protein
LVAAAATTACRHLRVPPPPVTAATPQRRSLVMSPRDDRAFTQLRAQEWNARLFQSLCSDLAPRFMEELAAHMSVRAPLNPLSAVQHTCECVRAPPSLRPLGACRGLMR